MSQARRAQKVTIRPIREESMMGYAKPCHGNGAYGRDLRTV